MNAPSRPSLFPRLFTAAAMMLPLAAPVTAETAAERPPEVVLERNVRAHEEFLASDAMQGRGSGTQFEWIAGQYVGSQLRQFGVEPAGDADDAGDRSYLQAVDLPTAAGESEKKQTWNAVGVLRGSDPKFAKEAILLSAHMDHLGVRAQAGPDSIYNGADDDASGVTAVLELARTLAAGERPKRTIFFVTFGSEEVGGLGAKHFLAHPPIALTQIVANLEFEMIGRPDPAVAPGTLWLTGYERSNLGPELARRGARLVADPHPEQKFFQRSDNYILALRGVVAQTVSSYGLHAEYHQPNDDVAHLDIPHMARAISSMVAPVRWLANADFKPDWTEGGRPSPPKAKPR